MDYEKKYKEALERARVLNNGEDVDVEEGTTTCEYIFPELKMSKDEMIRKELIRLLNVMTDGIIENYTPIPLRDLVAWLEKQGEESDYNPYKATIESISAMVEKYANGDLRDFYDNIKVKCKDAMEYDNTWLGKQGGRKYIWSEEDEYQINTILHGLDLKRKIYKKEGNKVEEERYNTQYNWLKSLKVKCEDVMEYDNIGLEKQGVEESPFGLKTIGESLGFTTQDECDKYHQIVSDCIVSDKAKFKVGDWITYDEILWLITGVKSPDYTLTSQSGVVVNDIISFVDNCFHHWTIEDAKDGDILANKAGAIFINAGIGSDKERVTLDCYCYLSVQNEFCIERTTTGSWFYKNDIKPATKEQCELLFSKMEEKGYEWNDERKELVLRKKTRKR